MQFRFLFISVCLLTGPARGQSVLSRLANRLVNDTSSATATRISVLPTISYALETGVTVGLQTFTLFYIKKDTTNRLSTLVLNSFLTTKGQYGVVLENSVYTNRNVWFLLGRAYFQRFPLLYFGIGPDRPNTNPALVNSVDLQIRQRALHRLRGNWYAGADLDYEHMTDVKFDYQTPTTESLPTGGTGTRTVGLGVAVVYDSRKNALNTRRGAFLELSTLRYNEAYGSQFNYQMEVVDARLYRPLGRPNRILAMQFFGQFMQGTVPFNNLALFGGERGLRGIYLGRYRDENLISTQVEVRWLPFGFSKRLGGNVFAGTGTVAPTIGAFRADHLRLAAGFGVQFLLIPRKDVFVRGDVGFSRENTGVYVSIGEAF